MKCYIFISYRQSFNIKKRLFLALILVVFLRFSSTAQQKEELISEVSTILQTELDEANIPGAVLLIKQGDQELFKQAFGYASLKDFTGNKLEQPEKTTIAHLYDLASLTKVIGITTSMMLLVDKGLVDLDTPISNYISGFDKGVKKEITIRHLLTHTAGLYEWYPLYYFTNNRQDTYKLIKSLPLKYPVGQGRHYSDLGFMLLGEIIESVSHLPLDNFMQKHIFRPLDMHHTMFNPLEHNKTLSIAATSHGNPFEYRMVRDTTLGFTIDSIQPDQWNTWRTYTLKGEVNDGNAWYANKGVSGHAGLFSTVDDLQKLIDMLKHKGKIGTSQLISEKTVQLFLTQDEYENGLGWVMDSNSPYLKHAPKGSFAHTGFTGTSISVVPEYNISMILLINRQNMGLLPSKVYYNLNPLREKLFTAVLKHATQKKD